MTDRRKNLLVLLIVAGLLAASLVVIFTQPTKLGLDLQAAASSSSTRARRRHRRKSTRESLEPGGRNHAQARRPARGRASPKSSSPAKTKSPSRCPDVSNAARAQDEVGKTAQLVVLRLGAERDRPRGQAAPTEASVTGGAPRRRPRRRRAQPSTRRSSVPSSGQSNCTRRHDVDPGLHAEQGVKGTCLYGTWYLIEPKHEKVLCPGGKPTARARKPNRRCTGTTRPPQGWRQPRRCGSTAGHRASSRRAPSKTPKARRSSNLPEPLVRPEGRPVLDGSDITNPVAGQRRSKRASRTSRSASPNTARASSNGSPRKSPNAGATRCCPVSQGNSVQHFAIVLDGQLITVPSIDFNSTPQVSTPRTARRSPAASRWQRPGTRERAPVGRAADPPALISRSQVSATLGKQALKQALSRASSAS